MDAAEAGINNGRASLMHITIIKFTQFRVSTQTLHDVQLVSFYCTTYNTIFFSFSLIIFTIAKENAIHAVRRLKGNLSSGPDGLPSVFI